MTIKQGNIDWHGDMNENCTAVWNGLLIRAEAMHGEGINTFWLWAVSSVGTGEELDS
jgi:hypothetical protein